MVKREWAWRNVILHLADVHDILDRWDIEAIKIAKVADTLDIVPDAPFIEAGSAPRITSVPSQWRSLAWETSV